MRTICFLGVILIWHHANSQTPLKGNVLDEANNPIPGASVFLNNTSIGTTANNEGSFELFVPAGRFDLIISSIGFQTHAEAIPATNRISSITIHLKIKASEMEAVVIEPYEKNGWEKWGRWFMENFLGTSEFTVRAIEPLIIENKSLGYRIIYQLENFQYDFKTHYLLYAGYPFFENLGGSDRKQRKWELSREDVYKGSMQFMRALFLNRTTEEGFEVRRLKKIINAEKQRVRMVYKTSIKADEMGRIISTVNPDSSAYYNHIMSQDDYKDVVGGIVTGDSIAYAVDSVTAGLSFSNYLLVIFKNKKLPFEYKQLFPKSGDELSSAITLINDKPIEILANGSYFNPEDLLSNGYWGWWEKIGTMLPFDYKPPAKPGNKN